MSGLPANWEYMGDQDDVRAVDYIDWSWKDALSTTGTEKALFDFRVFPYIDKENSAEVDEENTWALSFTFKVVDISGPTRGFNSTDQTTPPTQQRLLREILSLSYAVDPDTPLPHRGSLLFGKEGTAPYAVGAMDSPIVDTISLTPDKANSGVFCLTFKAKKIKYSDFLKPEPTENSPELRDPYPWEKKPTVNITFSEEEFAIGSGWFMGAFTPTEVGNVVKSPFGLGSIMTPEPDTHPYKVIANSVGDPFAAPPKTKVSVSNLVFNIAYDSGATGTKALSEIVNAGYDAMSAINLTSFDMNLLGTYSFSVNKGNAMLTALNVAPAEHIDTRDWLPKQKHPFGKTYAEIGWTFGSNQDAVAVNNFARTLTVKRAISYFNLSFTVTSKLSGWGVAIPNKGYRSFDEGDGKTPEAINETNSSKADERLLDADTGCVIAADVDTSEINCLMVYSPFIANEKLKEMLLLVVTPWARLYPITLPLEPPI